MSADLPTFTETVVEVTASIRNLVPNASVGSALFITIPADAILISPPTPSVCVPIVIVSTPEVGL